MGKSRAGGKKATGNGANLGFEEKLWAAADKLRGHMDAAEYKHVVLGLIFLKYISDAFQELHDRLAADKSADPEDRDEYTAENVFWVPKGARWTRLQDAAKQPTVGKIIDDAMVAIEKDNRSLKGVLPKDYARPTLFLDARKLGQLVDRTHRGLTDDEIARIGKTYHAWRGEKGAGKYADVPGFCKSAATEEIAGHGFVLTPGRYVGAEEAEDDGEPFAEKMQRLTSTLAGQFKESAKLEKAILKNLAGLGFSPKEPT